MDKPRLAKGIEEYHKDRYFPDDCKWERYHEYTLTSGIAIVHWPTIYYPGKPYLILTLAPHQFGVLTPHETLEAANAALDDILLIANHGGKHPHKLNVGYGTILEYNRNANLRIGQQIVNNLMPAGTVLPELFYLPNDKFWTDGLKHVHVIWDEDKDGTPINRVPEILGGKHGSA